MQTVSIFYPHTFAIARVLDSEPVEEPHVLQAAHGVVDWRPCRPSAGDGHQLFHMGLREKPSAEGGRGGAGLVIKADKRVG